MALDDKDLLRQGARRDRLGLAWLLQTSTYVHDAQGQESLPALLRDHPNLIWLRGRSIHGAIMPSLYRYPVVMVRYLVVRSASELRFLFGSALPRLEERLARLGVAQLGFHLCPEWLASQISQQGYHVQDRVIGYARRLSGHEPFPETDLSLRRAEWEDIEPVAALDHAAFAPFWRLNAEIIRQALYDTPEFWVAEADGQIMAYLLAKRSLSRAYISRIAVGPQYQGRGVGTALLAQALAALARQGVRQVSLNTQEDNIRSRALYARLGFQETGECDVYWSKVLSG